MIQEWYCKEKLDASHYLGSNKSWNKRSNSTEHILFVVFSLLLTLFKMLVIWHIVYHIYHSSHWQAILTELHNSHFICSHPAFWFIPEVCEISLQRTWHQLLVPPQFCQKTNKYILLFLPIPGLLQIMGIL